MKEEYRVARISNPPLLASLIAYAKRPLRFAEIMYKYWRNGGIASISASYPHILRIMGVSYSTIPYNDPKIHRLENIGSLGIGSARGMASTIATFFQAICRMSLLQHHLINDTLQQLIAVPVEYEDDLVLMQSLFRGYGFFYRQHPVRENVSPFIYLKKKNNLNVIS
uniref:Uncharacterized protein n=1 Tax=Parascaris equorum TaxID=6256 RepID=A0A914RPJ9_PAREQ